MDNASLDDVLATAETLAEKAGKLVLELRDDVRGRPATKTNVYDLVTEADRAAERLISEGIKSSRPCDGIIGEEGQRHNPESSIQWVIDPIDGTINYVHGCGPFAVSIGVEIDGLPIVGVINSLWTSEMFTAVQGRGAFSNGEAIKASATTELETAVIGLDCSTNREIREQQVQHLSRLINNVRDIRRIGCCTFALCLVAAGRLDASFTQGGGRWDYSAGTIIAREAGAWVSSTNVDSPTGPETLAVAPGIRNALQATMAGTNR